MPTHDQRRIRIAISACLLGATVRYNGGHKESRLCSETLARHFDFIPVCPEVEIGLGTPREPIRLVGDPQAPRALGTVNRDQDHSEPLAAHGRKMAAALDDISGYILMQKSPSCGMERVKVYRSDGTLALGGAAGLYAAAFMNDRPDLPVEEDGRLNDPVLRENFLTRVFAYARWQNLHRSGLSAKGLLDYHSSYKYQLMAHHPHQYRELGRLLADLDERPLETIADLYFSELMAALKRPATRGSHSNVLQHLSGYLKNRLDSQDRREIQKLISQYRQGTIPLVVPLTLLKHHLRKHPDPYLERQAYLQPHPEDLSLRNAI
ncbi:YbgA family protein [Stutzerimonas tarimensis]|uniref:YbgA family protein n=1 Tax=Stutzerimonas tarimensis TaxID=1507735 RepID=A0ABV7T4V9_9GAMM